MDYIKKEDLELARKFLNERKMSTKGRVTRAPFTDMPFLSSSGEVDAVIEMLIKGEFRAFYDEAIRINPSLYKK